MADLAQCNPTGRFTGLAELYAKSRPSYPVAAVDWIVDHCGLESGCRLVDVGSGTGISSRLFAQRGLHVLGLEPNAEMRAKAEGASDPAAVPPTYVDGRAEQTGLPDHYADAVLAAQAFHWFEPESTLREFHRILKPNGWVMLLWNERDDRDPFTAAYSAIVRSTPEAAAVELPRSHAGEPLLHSPLFQNAQRVVFANEQLLDEANLQGRAFSASYAPRQPTAAEAFAEALKVVFARFQQDGQVRLQYETSVYVGRRRV
jgi:ubiquinone/menaquinone biosynthesis C-methylase UbiE